MTKKGAKSLLITAFEPFGGNSLNSSWELAKNIMPIEGVEMVKIQLPVSFSKVETSLEEALKRINPDIVLMLGQTAKRTEVNIENVAVNWLESKKSDNDGLTPTGKKIDENGPTSYFSTLPIMSICQSAKDKGLSMKISDSAVTFVCKYTFYMMGRMASKMKNPPLFGFLHIPKITNLQEGGCLSMNEMLSSIEMVIRETIKAR